MHGELRSIDLHLDEPPGVVVATEQLRDVGCGMYPVYYVRRGGSVLASTSVVELIAHLGDFQENVTFRPPEFLTDDTFQQFVTKYGIPIADRMPSRLVGIVGKGLRSASALEARHSYPTWESIDTRIRKLRPFESVTPQGAKRTFSPGPTVESREELVRETASRMTSFVNGIERAYPDHSHVIMMGGKDSQLIGLVPKVSDDWHVFSSDPNFRHVKRFVGANDLDVGRLYRTDDRNRESESEFRRKLTATDLYSDPRHIRWLPQLETIANELGKCIFWQGTEGDVFNRYYPKYHDGSVGHYFESHFTLSTSWQGNYHQTFKNYTGRPLLSPYHSEEIWEELYRRFDPSLMEQGIDLREDIGVRLSDGPVTWPRRNPSPRPYLYDQAMNCRNAYLSTIYSRLT